MDYTFICPNCKQKEDIAMPMKEYHADNHFCKNCNNELVRDIADYTSIFSIDKTNCFYRKIN